MVKIDQIVQKYDVSITEGIPDSRGVLDSKPITLTDNVQTWLSVGVRLVDEELYSVVFFNNDFFEIGDADLLMVLEKILSGEYAVSRTGVLRKKSYIKINALRTIAPERIYDDRDLLDIYAKLPQQFSLSDI